MGSRKRLQVLSQGEIPGTMEKSIIVPFDVSQRGLPAGASGGFERAQGSVDDWREVKTLQEGAAGCNCSPTRVCCGMEPSSWHRKTLVIALAS
jgi:hypothetical protein